MEHFIFNSAYELDQIKYKIAQAKFIWYFIMTLKRDVKNVKYCPKW